MPRPILVSACLLGLLTRYDGATKRNEKVIRFIEENDLIPVPVCPEQLAGLPTPRPRTFFKSGDGTGVLDDKGDVINEHGSRMNDSFIRGAGETAKIARLSGCSEAILKERSPSCGVHNVYLGDTLIEGQGVTAAYLERLGIFIRSEVDL